MPYGHNTKCYKMLKWQKWTLKNYLCIRTQKVCPSMPSFVSAVLFIPSFNVLSCYFYDSLNLVAVPTAWILINFVTLLLEISLHLPQTVLHSSALWWLLTVIQCILQTLQKKLFKRKCKPNTIPEEPHKIKNLVNNLKYNRKTVPPSISLFCFFSQNHWSLSF